MHDTVIQGCTSVSALLEAVARIVVENQLAQLDESLQVSSVQAAIKKGDQQQAVSLLQAAKADFQGDPDYLQLDTLVQSTAATRNEVATLLSRIQKAENERRFGDIPTQAQVVAALSQKIDPVRESSFASLIGTAARLVTSNWRVALQVSQEAAHLGSVPAGLLQAIHREEREEEVSGILAEERTTAANLASYRERVASMLDKYSGETRLEDRLRLLDAALADQRKQDEKRTCATELALMCQELGDANDHRRLWDTYIRAKTVAAPFAGDPEINQHLEAIREQGATFEEAADALTLTSFHSGSAARSLSPKSWPVSVSSAWATTPA